MLLFFKIKTMQENSWHVPNLLLAETNQPVCGTDYVTELIDWLDVLAEDYDYLFL